MEPEGDIESNCDMVVEKFDDMNLKETLLRGIYAYGWVRGGRNSGVVIGHCVECPGELEQCWEECRVCV